MATTTLPISLRGGLVPVLRYGNYAGPGYAGRLGAETEIKDPSINNGQPILASVLTQTPQGLASFMKLALQTEPNGYLDSVTRMRYTQMQEADAQGNLHTITAGEMLEHEGYQGQVQVVDQGGVRNSYYATNESSWKIAS